MFDRIHNFKVFYLLVLGVLLIANPVQAKDVRFSWLPNSESDLAGYKIHFGSSPGVYTVTTDIGLPDPIDGRVYGVVSICNPGTFYFAATAYSEKKDESDYSNVITWKSPVPNIISIQRSE